jgi:hypothetical protein
VAAIKTVGRVETSHWQLAMSQARSGSLGHLVSAAGHCAYSQFIRSKKHANVSRFLVKSYNRKDGFCIRFLSVQSKTNLMGRLLPRCFSMLVTAAIKPINKKK